MKYILIIILTVTLSFSSYAEKEIDNLIIGKIKDSITHTQEIDDIKDFYLITEKCENNEFKNKKKITGQVIRSYYSHDQQSSYGIYKSYLTTLKNEGFEILFKGENKELGKNFQKTLYDLNPWNVDKNYSYSVPFLNGSDNCQYFISAIKKVAGKNIYFTLNTTTGWSEHPDYRIDIVNEKSGTPEIHDVQYIVENIMKKGFIDIYDIIFDENENIINEKSLKTLTLIAKYLSENTDKRFFIVGHTDNSLELSKGQSNSEIKAKKVRDHLINNNNINPDQIKTFGLGSLCPVFSNDDPIGREYNNRVSLVER